MSQKRGIATSVELEAAERKRKERLDRAMARTKDRRSVLERAERK